MGDQVSSVDATPTIDATSTIEKDIFDYKERNRLLKERKLVAYSSTLSMRAAEYRESKGVQKLQRRLRQVQRQMELLKQEERSLARRLKKHWKDPDHDSDALWTPKGGRK